MKAGRELDALIAEKVMGLQTCSDPIGRCAAAKLTPCQCWGVPDRNGIVSGGERASYSTDIAAAWEVMEKLREQWAVELHGRDQAWAVLIEDGDEVSAHFIATEEADTAPLAICLAALKAVGVETDT